MFCRSFFGHAFFSVLILTLVMAMLLMPSYFATAQQTQPTNVLNFTPPEVPSAGTVQPLTAAAGVVANTASNAATKPGQQVQAQIQSRDSVLGDRIAKITTKMEKIPKSHDQIWREYDITPYTKGRNFPTNTQPEQTIVDWILRQTGTKTWHSQPFGILTADSEKLYVYHTKDVQMIVADIVDRFVNPQFFNESCTVRVVSLSRPDWLAKGHPYLRPVRIASPGVQGWTLEKDGAQALIQELTRRTDFKELAPPQFLIPNGIAHSHVVAKKRTYLRDVQLNPTALNGYDEDRVTIDEGFGVSFVPLSCLDGLNGGLDIAASIKLDIVQIEKMIPLMIDVPTTANPRQRIQIESPQVACFKLDEMIRWQKNKILLLDLGTIPLPNSSGQTESQNNIFSGLAKSLSSSSRANVLLFIECVSNNGVTLPILPQQTQTVTPTLPSGQQPTPTALQNRTGSALGSNSYWRGIR